MVGCCFRFFCNSSDPESDSESDSEVELSDDAVETISLVVNATPPPPGDGDSEYEKVEEDNSGQESENGRDGASPFVKIF